MSPNILPRHPEKYHRLPVVVRVYSYRVRVIIRVRTLGFRVEIDVRFEFRKRVTVILVSWWSGHDLQLG